MSLQKYAFFSRQFVHSLCLPNKTEKKDEKKQGQSVSIRSVPSLGVCRSHVIKCVKRKQLANDRKKMRMQRRQQQQRGYSSQRPRRMLISFLDILFVGFFCRFDQGHFGRKK